MKKSIAKLILDTKKFQKKPKLKEDEDDKINTLKRLHYASQNQKSFLCLSSLR